MLAWKIEGIQLPEIPPIEVEIKTKRYFVLQVKHFSSLTDHNQINIFFFAHAWTVRGVKFQELCFNSCTDAAEKVISSRIKWP